MNTLHAQKFYLVRRWTTGPIRLPDFVATFWSGTPGSEPPHHCRSFMLEDAQTSHQNAGVSSCKAGKEMVVLLLEQPTKIFKLIKLMHSIKN